MDTEKMFEIAARTKLRVSTAKGLISIEQLWDVPLRSNDGYNLDFLAKAANKEVKSTTEESFVDAAPSAVQDRAALLFDLIKHVIKTKLAEEEAAKKKTANKAEREKLLRILAEKQEGKLTELSEKELQARINELM